MLNTRECSEGEGGNGTLSVLTPGLTGDDIDANEAYPGESDPFAGEEAHWSECKLVALLTLEESAWLDASPGLSVGSWSGTELGDWDPS